jgi:polygalacturonase
MVQGILAMVLCMASVSPASKEPFGTGGWINVKDRGVRGDGKAVETSAIQAVIDACSASGGGTVLFPAGTYLTGTLRIKDNVTLRLEGGAIILGSTDLKDYPETDVSFPSMESAFFRHALVFADGARNIAVEGQGRIDGQGGSEEFKRKTTEAPGRYMNRPSAVRFVNCTGVRLRDVRIENAGFWVTHLLACDDVAIDGVTVDSRTANYNNDGFDIDCCSNVRLSNCFVNSVDDAICLKSTGNRACRNVTITNCVLTSHCSGIRLGCEVIGGFQDIVISNVTIFDTYQSALQIQSFDGGSIERVSISGVTMRNVGHAILINVDLQLYKIGIPDEQLPAKRGETMGVVRNIILRDIQADGVGHYRGRGVGGAESANERKLACIISGMPESSLENVTLENVRLRFAGGGTLEDAKNDLSSVKNGFNCDSMGMTPAYGIYCRNVRNLRLRDVDLAYETDDFRPAVFIEKAERVDMSGIQGMAHADSTGLLRLRNVNGAFIHGCRPTGIATFVSAEGPETHNITFTANDLSGTAHPLVKGPDLSIDAVCGAD